MLQNGRARSNKRQHRVGEISRHSSNLARFHSSSPETSIIDASQKRRISISDAFTPSFDPRTDSSFPSSHSGGFNDSVTADVILRLHIESSPFESDSDSPSFVHEEDVHIHLHSPILRRSKYFAALLSDRWTRESYCNEPHASGKVYRLSFGVTATNGSIATHITVLKLLYTDDFGNAIDGAASALEILPVALELLFEDCVRACVRFLEAVPWSEEEEKKVLSLVPFLREEESRELLARVLPDSTYMSEDMLHGLILTAINNHPNMAFVKAFVAKLLRDFSSRDSAMRVLDRAFDTSLNVVMESLEEYSRPDFRGDHNETEAIQRLNLHTAMTNGRHLLWLVERMIELKVADMAVKKWCDNTSFTSDLQRSFRDDAWRNMVPGLPLVLLRCTSRLSNAVASGSILAPRQIRMKLVKGWLPVLVVCKDKAGTLASHTSVYVELEETFLRIISTLPMTDAQELLQQCLSFSTRNVDDCPHLVSAFNTWFRRATRLLPSRLFIPHPL